VVSYSIIYPGYGANIRTVWTSGGGVRDLLMRQVTADEMRNRIRPRRAACDPELTLPDLRCQPRSRGSRGSFRKSTVPDRTSSVNSRGSASMYVRFCWCAPRTRFGINGILQLSHRAGEAEEYRVILCCMGCIRHSLIAGMLWPALPSVSGSSHGGRIEPANGDREVDSTRERTALR